MVRGRTPGRGTRRGDAAGAERRSTDSHDGVAAEAGAASGPADRGSATPAPSTASRGSSGPALRRGTTARASRAAPAAGRFRPKNVRRDEAERDSLARQEEEKARERVAAERRARGRSRFRSKRSRGDAMGSRGGFGRPITGGASGPFSAGFGGAAGGRFGARPLGGPGGGFGGAGSSSRGGVKSDPNGPRGFNEVEGGRFREPRINADRLHANTPDEELDSEDEAMMTALGSRATSVLPMGIYRREHKEEEVVVATTAELEAAENATGEEESLWVDGEGPGAQPLIPQPEEGVWGSDTKPPVAIKKEPGTEDFMDLDVKPPSEQAETKPAVEPKKKKILPQDPEDQMIQSDLNLLANELGAVTIEEEGEAKTEGPANKDGRLYLFQFPPVLPPLKRGAIPQPATKVKPEPENANLLDSIASVDDAAPVDLTQDGATAQDQVEDDDGHDELENTHGFMSELLSKGGMIGKLRVRKSGRVELDWGGRTLEMNPAAGMNFLTTAVIVEENDEKPQAGVVGGESVGMGKIMGRFLLAPIWGEEEEWEVDPEELNAS